MRNFYEPHQQTTTTEHQNIDLGQVKTNAVGLNVIIGTNLTRNNSAFYDNIERHTIKYYLKELLV